MANVVERAFELAEQGCCKDIRQLENALRKEGYEQVQLHLRGYLIRKQLYGILNKKL